MAAHFEPYLISDIRQETADCISVAFDIPDHLKERFAFKAGQNLTVRTIVNGKEIRRSYSLCSSPHENEWRIAIKKIEGGIFSGFAHQELHKGQGLDLLPPSGNFHLKLNADNKKNYVAFAAGSGITPVISQIKSILATEKNSRITLVYGNRTISSMIFREALESIKNLYMDRFTLIHVFSRTKTDAAIHQGRIDAEKCAWLFSHVIKLESVSDFLLCGPADMIFTVRDFLEEKGIGRNQVHFELFNAPSARAEVVNVSENAVKEKSAVTIHIDGIRMAFDLPYQGMAVLDGALAAGADLPFACKGGVCATCRARLLEGEVVMDSNYALEKDELDAGFILTCQSHPRSPKLVIDFDQK